MFGFAKKEMDLSAAKAFWEWFATKEEWICRCAEAGDSQMVWAVDEQIKPVFPYFKKELEFQLGYNDGQGEFFFFHLGNRFLMRDGAQLGKLMPPELAKRWTFILEE